MKAVHRFVDLGGSPHLERPVATILGDTRLASSAPRLEGILLRNDIPVPASGRLSLRVWLPGRLQAAQRIVAIPQLKVSGEWRKLPPVLLEPRGSRDRRSVRIELPVPSDARGTGVGVYLKGYALDSRALASVTTPEISIPEGAEIEFSIGILEPAWTQGAVQFSLQACTAGACRALFAETVDPTDAALRGGWRERRVSLAQMAGTTRSFLFEARPADKQGRFSLPVWGNPTIYAPAPRPEGDYNLVLLSIDTLRADRLPSYGHSRETAPFIDDRFAKQGTIFENCVAVAATTAPSHMTMFTSFYPSTHGVVTGMEVLPRHIRSLPELVRSQGIETGAITENGWLLIQQGFGRGFDTYVQTASEDAMKTPGEIASTFAKARAWLERNRNKRFFLFLHTYQVHNPYTPPAQYRDLYVEPGGIVAGEDFPEHLRELVDYDREIRYADDELRALFDALEELGLGRNTIFMVTSDHGEEFLEHGLLRHGAHLYEESVHVPLMLWGPGIPANRRIASPVSQIDLMPTVLELLGIPIPSPIPGSSLVPLIDAGSAGDEFESRPAFSEAAAPHAWGEGRKLVSVKPPAYGVRLGSRKLTRYRTDSDYRYEYYDLASDPLEQRNLYPTRADEAADLVALIADYERRSAVMRSRLEAGGGAPRPHPSQIFLDPEQEENLKALGYIP